jgi:hypothetical protein
LVSPKHLTVPLRKSLNLASRNYHIRQYLYPRTREHDEQVFVAKELEAVQANVQLSILDVISKCGRKLERRSSGEA